MMDEDVIKIPMLALAAGVIVVAALHIALAFADAPIDAPACTLVLGQDDNARVGAEAHAE